MSQHPINRECRENRHGACDGIARVFYRRGQEPAPECPCACHYPPLPDTTTTPEERA